MNPLVHYLNQVKIELQEIYEDIDSELRNTDNAQLIDDSYHNVVSKLESALNEMDSLVNDLDAGIYDKEINLDDDTLEVNE